MRKPQLPLALSPLPMLGTGQAPPVMCSQMAQMTPSLSLSRPLSHPCSIVTTVIATSDDQFRIVSIASLAGGRTQWKPRAAPYVNSPIVHMVAHARRDRRDHRHSC